MSCRSSGSILGRPGPRGRERQRHRIGQHVPGIGEQGQRAGDDAADHFDQHERASQDERNRHPALVTFIGVAHNGVDLLILNRDSDGTSG